MRQSDKYVSPMSNEGRNAYVTEHITAAMLSLLKEKPLVEITISELCDRASVGRTSFYRNFQEKEDILKEYIRRMFQAWMDALAEDPPLDEVIRVMFSHFEAHQAFYALLHERGLIWLLKDVILSVCGFHPEQEAVNAYASAFVAYSLYGWVEVWFLRGMKESAEEMAELFVKRRE